MRYTDNIKKEFNKCTNKVELIKTVAGQFNMTPMSVKNNWFSRYWAIPDYRQEKLIDLMQKFNEKTYKNSKIKI